MRLSRQTQAQAALPLRAPQAFVADYDDVVGAAARGAEDGIRPLCQRVVQAAGNGINRLAGRSAVSADHVGRASQALARGAGMAVMIKGAQFAAEACQGALENARQAQADVAAWRDVAQYWQPTGGDPQAQAAGAPQQAQLARLQAAAAQRHARVGALGAAGAAVMAATLLSSSTLLGALGGPVPLLGAAALGAFVCAASIPRDAKAQYAQGAGPAWQRAVPLLTAGGSWAIGGAITASLALLAAAGVPTVGLATASLGAAIGLMGSYGLAQAFVAHQDNTEDVGRRQRLFARLANLPEAVDPTGDGPLLACSLDATFAEAHRWGVGAQVGGVAMVAGLFWQLTALWPGVSTILLGSVVMEYARFRRNALLPPLRPELPAGPAVTPPTPPIGSLLGQLTLRRELNDLIPPLPTAWGRKLAARWRRPSLIGLDAQIGDIGGRAEQTLALAATPLATVPGQWPWPTRAACLADGLDGLGLGPDFARRIDADESNTMWPDPTDADSYRPLATAALYTLWEQLPGTIDARIGDAYQRVVTHPDVISAWLP